MAALRIRRAGMSAVLIELDDLAQVMALHHDLRGNPPTGTVDVVPAARTVLVVFDGSMTNADRVVAEVEGRAIGPVPETEAGLVEVPVVYDGPDLPAVAEVTGLTEREVVAKHLAGRYRVAFCGFAPGFAYIAGGDPALRVSRRDSPRTKVPAGSVGLADEFTGIYPREMPGGWQLIGQTDAMLWDLGRDPPALLPPGTTVRFVER